MNFRVNLNVCRVCLKSPGSSIDIFTDPVVIEKFQYITQLKLIKNDGMPDLLCSRCRLKLRIAYDFRKQSLLSDSHMREFVNEMTREMNNKFQLVAKKTDGFDQSEEDINQFIKETNSDDDELNILNETNQFAHNNNLVESTSENILQVPNNELETKIEEMYVNGSTNIIILKSNSDHYDSYRSEHEIDYNFMCEEDKINNNNEEPKLIGNGNGETNNMIEINQMDESQESSEFDKYFELDDDKDLRRNSSTSTTYLLDDDKSNQQNEIENIVVEDIDELEEIDASNLLDNDKKIFHVIKTNDLQYEIELKDQNKLSESTEIIENISETEKSKGDNDLILMPKNKSRRKSNTSSTACSKCDKTFSSKTNLRRHELTHNDEKPYKCNECGAGFTQSGSLKVHVLGHKGIKPFKCQVCNEAFTQCKTLKFHMRRHTGEKPFQCEFCQMRFRQKDCMKRHIKAKHPGNKSNSAEVFLCGLCGRLLHSKYSMDQHALKHKKQLIPLRCIVCKKTFNTKEELDDHQDKNHGTQFQCDKCSKSFPKHASLLTHMKIHLGNSKSLIENKSESNYICTQCGKKFSVKKNLIDHLQTHILKSQPIEVYRCVSCNDIFHNKQEFENHQINDHNETFKFDCSVCNLEFISDEDLSVHLYDKHDDVNETCTFCLEHFTSRKIYSEHILDHQILVTIE